MHVYLALRRKWSHNFVERLGVIGHPEGLQINVSCRSPFSESADEHSALEYQLLGVNGLADAPYRRAKSQWRLAESLAALDPDDPEVLSLVAEVEDVAAELGAKPLLDAARATRDGTPR